MLWRMQYGATTFSKMASSRKTFDNCFVIHLRYALAVYQLFWAQCYKTFYNRNLHFFVISQIIYP
jgi:hypothetical protein